MVYEYTHRHQWASDSAACDILLEKVTPSTEFCEFVYIFGKKKKAKTTKYLSHFNIFVTGDIIFDGNNVARRRFTKTISAFVLERWKNWKFTIFSHMLREKYGRYLQNRLIQNEKVEGCVLHVSEKGLWEERVFWDANYFFVGFKGYELSSFPLSPRGP